MKAKAAPKSSSLLAPLFRSRSINVFAGYVLGILSTGLSALVNHRDTSCPAKAGDTDTSLAVLGIVLIGTATFLLASKLTLRRRPAPLWACLIVSIIVMAVYFVFTVVLLLIVQPGGLFDCMPEGAIGL